MHGGTHSCVLQNFSLADLMQNLVGKHPKPFNNFGEIGCAPLVLFLVKIVIRQSRLLCFFLLKTFLAIGSWESPLHSHGAKIGTKIIRAGLHHSLLDGNKLFFVYKEFDLYRSLAISVIRHKISSLACSIKYKAVQIAC